MEQRHIRRLAVFCGAHTGTKSIYAEQTRLLARLLAQHRIGAVYGGGHIGLMGVLADGILEAGGDVIGVIPQDLVDRELAHGALTELRIVNTEGFFDPLLHWLSHQVAEGFLQQRHRNLLVVAPQPDELLTLMHNTALDCGRRGPDKEALR